MSRAEWGGGGGGGGHKYCHPRNLAFLTSTEYAFTFYQKVAKSKYHGKKG